MNTAIVSPLKGEFSVLIHELEQLGFKKRNLGLSKLEAFEFNELDLLIVYGGHGKAQFGIQAQYLLCQVPQIELLVCAGVAGALSNSLRIGDVVVATEIVEHDFNLKLASRSLPRFRCDSQSIDNLKQLLTTQLDFAIHFGAVASGDEDIITETRKQEVAQLTVCGQKLIPWWLDGVRKGNPRRFVTFEKMCKTVCKISNEAIIKWDKKRGIDSPI